MATLSSDIDSGLRADDAAIWRALLACRAAAAQGGLPAADALALGADGTLVACRPDATQAVFVRNAAGHWAPGPALEEPAAAFAELYLPLCAARRDRPYVVGHLGQSVDGFIATRSGDSDFVTGPENIRHLHRMRALADAVIVGAGTVASDDPALTTREVAGPHPVRVVLDPRRRLDVAHRVFTDGAAPTWLVCGERHATSTRHGDAEVVGVPTDAQGALVLDVLLQTLWARGYATAFVEGGGVTVSRFLLAGLLQRLQIAIAPLAIGSGRPGLTLPARAALADSFRPGCRVYRMGADVLFDFEPHARVSPTPAGLARVY
jgi:riboflavin-specific deaminase-like protein